MIRIATKNLAKRCQTLLVVAQDRSHKTNRILIRSKRRWLSSLRAR